MCEVRGRVAGMRVVKVGGPVYRIGVGGGAASSVEVQGDNAAERDFAAVQRGDAEMGQKMNRVVRAAVEMGARNPICSIHDQGAGGNGGRGGGGGHAMIILCLLRLRFHLFVSVTLNMMNLLQR